MTDPQFSLRRIAIALGTSLEWLVDQVRRRSVERFHSEVPFHVLGYRGFGNNRSATLGGRVLAYQQPLTDVADTLWDNLKASYRRFETDEVPNVVVRAEVGGSHFDAVTDEEGYFAIEVSTADILTTTGKVMAELSLPDHADAVSDGPVSITMPGPDAEFGVISDIDDTVLVTNATSIVRMMKLTLLQSSKTRLAFDGVAAFYRALHRGRNPFFYVSSSPWNLYEFLTDFMALNQLVEGPLLLRDYGIDNSKFIAGPHTAHKLGQIRRILNCYPALPFLLIGDSGQDDPEIYETVTQEFPGRILAIYIRDVANGDRDREVQQIVARLRESDVDMLLVPDTLAAANHAADRGWIPQRVLPAIRREIARNRQPEPLLDEAADVFDKT